MDPDALRNTLRNILDKPENVKSKSGSEFENKQVLFSWVDPYRAYKKTSTGVLRFYIALALLLTLLVYLISEAILIFPIWAVLFLGYVLTITPPHEVEYKITLFGIEISGKMYQWELLSSFYFTKRFDYDILVIIGQPPYYEQLYLVVSSQRDKEKIYEILQDKLIYIEKPSKSMTDKLANWVTTLMPEEADQAGSSKGSASAQQSQTDGPTQ